MKKVKELLFIFILMLALTGCWQSDKGIEEEATEMDNSQDNEIIYLNDPIKEGDFLKAKGKNLYTQKGQGDLVNLRGVNVGGYLFQEFWMTPTKPGENVKAELDIYQYLYKEYGKERALELIDVYQDAYFSEMDFDNLAGIGVNVIRLPFWYLNIVDMDGQVKDNWFERFDWFIEEAGKRGIYVILDFHGAPGSQNGSDHSGIDGEDNKESASEFFFGDLESVLSNQDLYYLIWETIVSRYNGNPVIAGYDLLNEPYCTYRYDSSKSADELHNILWDVYDEAYKRIRAIDEEHIIIMEATWDPVDLPDPEDFAWTNIMYQYHNYLFDDYNNDNNKQITNMEKKINLIKAASYDVPKLMGEFSYFNNLDTWDTGLKLFNDSGINWTMWTYKVTSDYGNWGLYHHTGGDINIEKINDEVLSVIWAKVGDSRPNQNLIDLVSKYITSDFVEYD